MRISPIAAALAAALASAGGVAHAASLIELTTPNAQATKFSQNGEYLVASVFGTGGLRWTASTGAEDLVQDMVYANGVNNAGTISGARSDDGGSANGGHDLPAVSPIGAATSTPLPMPAGIDNVDVYDLADDGSAVGLAWTDDFSVAKAYYYSPVDGVVDLPVDNTTSASRGNVIIAVTRDGDGDDDFFDEDGYGLLGSIVSVRTDLAAGDLRPLYLVWLHSVASGELDDEALITNTHVLELGGVDTIDRFVYLYSIFVGQFGHGFLLR